MSFERITRRGGSGRATADTCRVKVARGGPSNPYMHGTVFLPRPVLAALGWAVGDRVLVEVGSGTDAGTLRLSSSDTGSSKLDAAAGANPANSSLRLSIPPRYLSDGPLKTTPVPHRIVGASLILTLPARELAEAGRTRIERR